MQFALDYGIAALLLLIIFCGWQIVYGKQSRADKEIVIFIITASLIDFHCQYLFMAMLICLFFDYGDCVKEKRTQIKENYILLPVVLVVFVYVGIAAGSSRYGNQELALYMLPDYTYAQEKKILASIGMIEAYDLANRLIEKNPYNLTAYIARGSFYALQLEVSKCIEDLDKMLELDPYHVENYVQYEALLKNMKNTLIMCSGEDNTDIKLLQDRLDSLPVQLEAMKERTSALAYKIKDRPIFSY